MAVITPNTDVILLKVPLEISDSNQLTFANATAQYNYFYGLSNKIELDNYTYQRKDNTIRVGMLADDLYDYNYVMYRNANHDNKWYYAFIIGVDYINDSVSAVKIKTDVWQTYQFDLTYKPVFVEREHTNDDTIGSNLVPENIETGEWVKNGTETSMGYKNLRYVINATYAPYSSTVYQGTDVYGIPIGGGLFVFDYWTQMVNALQGYANNGHLDSISQVYVVPYISFNDNDLEFVGDDDDHAYWLFNGGTTPTTKTVSLSRPNTIDNYTPRNNKLLTGQFQNILINNNNGSIVSLDYEYFTNTASITIEGKCIPTVGASIIVYPKNYKGIEYNYNEDIIGGKFPTLSWSGDAYTNWLTQNAVNIGAGVASDVAKLPMVPVNPVVSGASLLTSVAGQVSEIRKHSLVSQTIHGNVNGGDVNTANKTNDILIYPMSITSQFAQIIDSYFDMFGYKTNKVKLPNITGRTNWNYVKTVGCYIEANIPQEDLAEIKSMFDNGITFWHNPATFADYSQSNGIVV